MADRRIVIFARLTLTALRSALLVGFPTMTEILGRFERRPHSLKKRKFFESCPIKNQ